MPVYHGHFFALFPGAAPVNGMLYLIHHSFGSLSMASHCHALAIINGKNAGNELLRQAINDLRDAGYRLEVRLTWESSDTGRYLQEALQLGASTVIAGGGDGTINQIVNQLAGLDPERRPALGILPLGTANDFATSVGIPDDLASALHLAVTAPVTPVDIICVNHEHYFINMATGGFGPRITSQTPAKLKAALGGVSYLLHGLSQVDTLKADHFTLSCEDFNWQGDALVVGIGNGRQAGGGQRLCPGALIDDGLMDISIITAREWLPTLMHTLTRDDENPNIIRTRSKTVEIHAEHEMTFNLDGEPLSGNRFTMSLIPQAIPCRLPATCPLLSEPSRPSTADGVG